MKLQNLAETIEHGNLEFYNNRSHIREWLTRFEVQNFIIKPDLTVDVDGDVIFYFESGVDFVNSTGHIPVQFNSIFGDFIVTEQLNLKSMKGFPKHVKGEFVCRSTRITSLEHGPTEVGGNYIVANNSITTLKGVPKMINGTFDCSDNDIESFEHGPRIVDDKFIAYNNSLKSVDYMPREVGGNAIDLRGNNFNWSEIDKSLPKVERSDDTRVFF